MAVEPQYEGLEVRIEPMTRRHLKGVLRIESDVYPRPWSSSLFLSELALRASRAYFVAKVGRHVVGYAGVMIIEEDGHITTIAVDPEWQRREIGRRLLLVLAREAIRRGATNLTLEVRVRNDAAQALYRQFKFAPVGVRANYYQETGEDALVMWVERVHQTGYRLLLDKIEAGIEGITIFDPGDDE